MRRCSVTVEHSAPPVSGTSPTDYPQSEEQQLAWPGQPVQPMAHGAESGLALAVGLFLFAVYLLSYRGGFHSADEVSMYAVSESLVKFGRFNTDQVAWTQWATTQREAQGFFGVDGHVYSKKGLALSLFAAPMYWLALHVPGIGLLQTTLLLNPLVTALTASFLWLTVRRLGYTRPVATILALTYGLATIAWVYAKFLFSESLAALLLLAAAYFLLAWRQERKVLYPAGAGLGAGLAIVARANNLFLAPLFAAYLAVVLGQEVLRKRLTWQQAILPAVCFLLSLGLAGGIVPLYNALRSGSPLNTGYDLSIVQPAFLWGLYRQLLSPPHSLFIFSPILLLSLVGCPAFICRHKAEAGLTLGAVILTVFVFSTWTSGEGLSWGSRFLMPVVPFLMLPLVPLIARWRWWPISTGPAIFLALALLSAAIQFLGVAVNIWVYMAYLNSLFPAELLEYTPIFYDYHYIPIFGQISSFRLENSDVAWWQPWGFDAPAFVALLALLILSGASLIYLLRVNKVQNLTTENAARSACTCLHSERSGGYGAGTGGSATRARENAEPLTFSQRSLRLERREARRSLAVVGLNALAALLVLGFTLPRYYRNDLQYGPWDSGYTRALQTISWQSLPTDAIVTVAQYHYHVPMNRYKGRLPIIGFAQDPPPLPHNAERLLQDTLSRHERVWFITVGLPPADPTNGIERWLNEHAYKASDDWHGDARLCLYATGQDAAPTTPVDARLGASILLRGYRLQTPGVRGGEILRLALTWKALQSVDKDYTVFVHLLDEAGQMRAQRDSPPVGGYRPTSEWDVGELVEDRYGIPLPADLPPGEYALAVGMYDAALQRLPVSDSIGRELADGRVVLKERVKVY
jgi:hypothetical protein